MRSLVTESGSICLYIAQQMKGTFVNQSLKSGVKRGNNKTVIFPDESRFTLNM